MLSCRYEYGKDFERSQGAVLRVAATELARQRGARGISQQDLARMLGLTPSTLSTVENGWRVPWPKLKADCARLLGVSENELFPPGEVVER